MQCPVPGWTSDPTRPALDRRGVQDQNSRHRISAPGLTLDDPLRERIRDSIRTHASPRHVPDEILAAPGIPHTRTGKRLEVPVKRLLRGERPEEVCDPQSVDDPGLLEWFSSLRPQRPAR